MDSVWVHLTRRCISVLENVLIKVVDSIKNYYHTNWRNIRTYRYFIQFCEHWFYFMNNSLLKLKLHEIWSVNKYRRHSLIRILSSRSSLSFEVKLRSLFFHHIIKILRVIHSRFFEMYNITSKEMLTVFRWG